MQKPVATPGTNRGGSAPATPNKRVGAGYGPTFSVSFDHYDFRGAIPRVMTSKILKTGAAAVAAALIVAACATTSISLPPITSAPSGLDRPGVFVWHDLLTTDPAAAKRFYGGLFDWTFRDFEVGRDGSYTVIYNGETPIGGIVDARQFNAGINVSQWIPVLSVTDVDAAVATTLAAGGRTFADPVDIEGRGRMAVIGDPQGAVMSLLRSASGDPRYDDLTVSGFIWNEIWADNIPGALDFYTRVAGYNAAQASIRAGETYHYLSQATVPVAGVLQNPIPGLRPSWVSYVGVRDVDETLARVENLGGRIIFDTVETAGTSDAAAIVDPSGAGLMLQTWPLK